jgi:hypothetical protein
MSTFPTNRNVTPRVDKTLKGGDAMERRINMSTKELDRLDELKKVHEKRQVLRLSRRLKLEGPGGLVSRKVGARGNHRLPDGVKERAIELILATYRDFGPTLAYMSTSPRGMVYGCL